MSSPPTFRDFVKAIWSLVSNEDGRQLKAMGNVRPELLRVVGSTLNDDEAALRMRPIVQANPRGAKATLRYVTDVREGQLSFKTDRAYRLMVAAIENTAPSPIKAENAVLFERERTLGWMPLEDGFKQLVELVPELHLLEQTAGALAADEVAGARQTYEGVKATEDAYRPITSEAMNLVGQKSQHPDPLVRSSLAIQLVLQYLNVLAGRPGAPDPKRPLLEWKGRDRADASARRQR